MILWQAFSEGDVLRICLTSGKVHTPWTLSEKELTAAGIGRTSEIECALFVLFSFSIYYKMTVIPLTTVHYRYVGRGGGAILVISDCISAFFFYNFPKM
jgi:hypothetical protein